MMLRVCTGEQCKLKEPPMLQLSKSLADRDFSASGHMFRISTAERGKKLHNAQLEEAESTLRETDSLNYEEARALLGRLEYYKGNFEAALQVYNRIDIKTLSPKMSKAITERTRYYILHSNGENISPPSDVMSLHSVSLLLEAILYKAESLERLKRVEEAAEECKTILDIVESALPKGIPEGFNEECKLEEMFHKALDLLPKLYKNSGFLTEAIVAYRRALITPWNLHKQTLASKQKELAIMLLYGGLEETTSNVEEAILLLFILMRKILDGEINFDQDIFDHLTFGLSICGQFEALASQIEESYIRGENSFLLALCYTAAGKNDVALNLLKIVEMRLDENQNPHIPSLLLGAKLCAQGQDNSQEGISLAIKVIESTKNVHFLSMAQKYLGVCYGNAARISTLDSERSLFHRKSIEALNDAALSHDDDPDAVFNLAMENAQQRNLNLAFSNAMLYCNLKDWDSARGWRILALIVSAEQRFKDAETIVNLALDETSGTEEMEFLRLKAKLQIAQEHSREAIKSYKKLLTKIHAHKENQADFMDSEEFFERRLEMDAWLDLAELYLDFESWVDAETCVSNAELIHSHTPQFWHTKGLVLEAQSLHIEALIAYTISLSIEPDFVPSIISTAEVMIKASSSQIFPIARSFLMNALRLDPTNHRTWSNLAFICKKNGSLQQAADFFQAAYVLQSTAPVQSFF